MSPGTSLLPADLPGQLSLLTVEGMPSNHNEDAIVKRLIGRYGYLVYRLRQGEKVSVRDIQDFCAKEGLLVTDRTARDYMSTLLQMRLRRYAGGIEVAHGNYFDNMRRKHVPLKRAIAEEALDLFDASTSVLVSAGSTASECANSLMLSGRSPVIVTNSLALVEHRCSSGVTIHLVGGTYNENINALIGEPAVEGFKKFSPTRDAIVGVSGIELEYIDAKRKKPKNARIYVNYENERPVLKSLLEAVSEKLILVFDCSKIGHADPWEIGDIVSLTNRVDTVIVTNDPREWTGELETKSLQRIEVIEAGLHGLQSLARSMAKKTKKEFSVRIAKREKQ